MKKSNIKNNIVIYLCIILFAGVGIYLTFFAGNTKKFDRRTEAFKIEPNETYDSDDGTMYQPIYYFQVKGKEYECESKSSGSSYPNKKKNKVYYQSNNPTKCLTEYDKSSSAFGGILCLIVTAVMIFLMVKKPSQNSNNSNENIEANIDKQQYSEEDRQKVIDAIGKISLIYKRVILGIIILVLLAITLFDTLLLKQTIKTKDYPETTAEFVSKKDDPQSEVFDDYIYTFTDKNGKQQEIIISISKETEPEQEIKIKYNENDPQDFYEEGSTLTKSGIIWYIVKVVAIIILIILFFNKKLLSKVNLSLQKD